MPALGANPEDHLPITLCGWGVIFGSYMPVTKNRTPFDIPYFRLFSGTIFALITLLFFLAYLKWLIKDRRSKKAAA